MDVITQLYFNLGCDLTTVPANEFQCFLLALKFIAASTLIIMFLRFLFKIMLSMLGGRW